MLVLVLLSGTAFGVVQFPNGAAIELTRMSPLPGPMADSIRFRPPRSSSGVRIFDDGIQRTIHGIPGQGWPQVDFLLHHPFVVLDGWAERDGRKREAMYIVDQGGGYAEIPCSEPVRAYQFASLVLGPKDLYVLVSLEYDGFDGETFLVWLSHDAPAFGPTAIPWAVQPQTAVPRVYRLSGELLPLFRSTVTSPREHVVEISDEWRTREFTLTDLKRHYSPWNCAGFLVGVLNPH